MKKKFFLQICFKIEFFGLLTYQLSYNLYYINSIDVRRSTFQQVILITVDIIKR